MNATMHKAVWTASMVGCMIAGAVSPDAAQAAETKARIAVAFPKSYNRVETATLYAKYLQSLERCAGVAMVNLRGDSITERFDLVDILSEAQLLEGMQAGKLHMAQFTTGLVPV